MPTIRQLVSPRSSRRQSLDRHLRVESLESRMLLNAEFRNPVDNLDVNSDGTITALDALLVINDISRNRGGQLPAIRDPQRRFVDTTGDNMATALDALRVINFLSRNRAPLRTLTDRDLFESQQNIDIRLGLTKGARIYRLQVDANFGTPSNNSLLPDLFSVYLVDPTNSSQTLLDRGVNGTSLFSLSPRGTELATGLARWDGSVLELDLSSISDADTGRLRIQLINGDSTSVSTVVVRPLTNAVDAGRAPGQRFSIDSPPINPAGSLDVTALTDSTTIQSTIENVRFDSSSGQLVANVGIRNLGAAIGRNVVLALPGLPAGVTLQNASGMDSTGTPYLNLRDAIRAGGLGKNELSDRVELRINNPSRILLNLQPKLMAGSSNRAPQLPAISTQTVMPGGRLEIQLNATDSDGDALTFTVVGDKPLPHGNLHSSSSSLVFTPTPGELGTYQVTVAASDNALTTSRTFTLQVIADPTVTTRVSGRVLDVDQTPLAGIQVELGSVHGLTRSDGSFALDVGTGPLVTDTLKIRGETFVAPAQPDVVYPFIAEKLPLILEHDVYARFNNVISRPIYLPKLDMANGKTINPSKNTLVTTDAIPGASVVVAAGTLMNQQGSPFTGVLSITDVPTDLTPAALPFNLFPDLVVTIQPGDMVFTRPAPISLPNRAGVPAGTLMDLYSINPVTGQFDIVGTGQVSTDGETIDTIEGGVRNSSWHFFVPPPPPDFKQPSENNKKNGCKSCEAASRVASEVRLFSGNFVSTIDLPTYQSLGETRGVRLTYDSLRAFPTPIVNFGFHATGNARAAYGRLLVEIGNNMTAPTNVEQGGLWGLDGLGGPADMAIQAYMIHVPSGQYPYAVQLGLGTTIGGFLSPLQFAGSISDFSGKLVSVNYTSSPFGSGWGVAGLKEVVRDTSGSVLIFDGEGELVYEPRIGSSRHFVSPPGDFSKLELMGDNTFQLTETSGIVYEFDASDKLVSSTDRNGNQTVYIYDAQKRIVQIVDPAGLKTGFAYDGAGRISTITDPAGRVTRMNVDGGGNLQSTTLPDGSVKSFEYDANHHMTVETDPRGGQATIMYGFHGRVTQVVRQDGIPISYSPVETQSLYPRSAFDQRGGITQFNLPRAMNIRDSVATRADANGNVIDSDLDQAGQLVESTDAVGGQDVIERNANNLVTSVTDAAGNIVTYDYDERGNPIRIGDSPAAAFVTGSISQPGERDVHTFTLTAPTRVYLDRIIAATNLQLELSGPPGIIYEEALFGRETFDPPVFVLDPGDYTLTIDGLGDATADYRVGVFDLDSASPIALDKPYQGVLAGGTEAKLFQFQAAAGERYFVDILVGVANANQLDWSLIDSTGRELSTAPDFVDAYVDIVTSGTHTFIVKGAAANTEDLNYSFALHKDVVPQPIPINVNENVRGNLRFTGQRVVYTFVVTPNSQLFFQTPQNRFDRSWSITGPDGLIFEDGNFGNAILPIGEHFELTPGSYQVEISGRQFPGFPDVVGEFLFSIVDLSAAPLIAKDSVIDGVLSQFSSARAYRFNALAGDQLDFSVSGPERARWTLRYPNGETVFDVPFSTLGNQALVSSGTYTLLLYAVIGAGPIPANAGFGNYQFQINSVGNDGVIPFSGTPIELNQPITGALGVGFEDRFTFSLANETLVYFDGETPPNPGFFTLLGPEGPVPVCVDVCPTSTIRLPAGDYQLTLDPIDDVGTYEFRLRDVGLATPIAFNTLVTDQLSRGETDFYRFDAIKGDRLFFDGPPPNNAMWRLYDPRGREVFSSNFSDLTTLTGFTTTVFNSLLHIPNDVFVANMSGTYSLYIESLGPADPALDYQFAVYSLAPDLTQPLTIDEKTSGIISKPGEMDFYTFKVSEPGLFKFDSFVDRPDLQWTLAGPSGVVTTSTFGIAAAEPIRLTAGDYRIVVDGLLDAIGPYEFTLLNLSTATVITPEIEFSGNLISRNQIDRYRFDALTGDRVFLDVTNQSEFGAFVSLLDPFGRVIVATSNLLDIDFGTLPLSGRYTLLVEDRQLSVDPNLEYSARIFLHPSAVPQSLLLGVPIKDAISTAGEQDKYSFTLLEDKYLYIDVQDGVSGGIKLTLTGPSGVVIDRQQWSSVQSRIESPAGKYTLTINDFTDQIGDYAFQVLDLGSARPLAVGIQQTGTLSPATETDAYRFDASAGDSFSFSVQSTQNAPSAIWRLVDPLGTDVFIQSITDVPALTLPATGTYTLLIEGSLADLGGPVGQYSFTANLVSSNPRPPLTGLPLNLGQVISGRIATIAEQDHFLFTLTAKSVVYFDSLTASNSLVWSLRGKQGTIVQQVGMASDSSQPIALPAGTYQLTVEAQSLLEDYSFRLLDLAAAEPLVPGAVVSGTLVPIAAAKLYRLSAKAGDAFFFDMQSFGDLTPAQFTSALYDPAGHAVFSTRLEDAETFALLADGEYTLIIAPPNSDTGASDPSFSFNLFSVAEPRPIPISLGSPEHRDITYDPIFNRITSITDELGHRTLFDIDPNNGNVRSSTRVVGALGGSDDEITRYTYDAHGLLASIIDPLGRVTQNQYDALGRLIRTIYAVGTPDEASQRLEYDAAGNLTALVDENGGRSVYQYDALNRVTKVTEADPDGTAGPLTSPVTTFVYDAAGNLAQTTDANGNTFKNEYDALDRRVKAIDPKQGTTQFVYDNLGNVLKVTDPLGHVTSNQYDARNRLIKTTDAVRGITTFEYDAADRLVTLADPVHNTSRFVYDYRDRLVQEIDPLGASLFYQYDATGNLVIRRDRDDRKIEYKYDDLNQLVQETWLNADGSIANIINSAYDAVGNLTAIVDDFSSLAYVYDNRDRVTSVDNGGTPDAPQVVLTYQYDAIGNVRSVADKIQGAAAGLTQYVYDALNRTTRVQQSGVGVSEKRVDLAYNALGQFAMINRFSDLAGTQPVVATTYTYDTLNRLTSLVHNNGATDVAFYNYKYDAASRISQIVDIDGTTNYSYDNRDQLTAADHSDLNNPDERYAYDANGNRISSHLHGNGYVTGPANRLLSDGTYNYQYDAEGNQIRRTDIATGDYRELIYDQRNRLTIVIDFDVNGNKTQTVLFNFDALNRRISKQVDDAIISFVYDREDVVLDLSGSDSSNVVVIDRYLHGPAFDQVFAQQSSSRGVNWLLTDHLGSTRDLVDRSGSVVDHITYASFGNDVRHSNELSMTRFRFSGREYDAEIDMDFFRSRFFMSDAGRFIGEDLIRYGARDINLYRYAFNSPSLFVDPLGTDGMEALAGLPAAPPNSDQLLVMSIRNQVLQTAANAAPIVAGGAVIVAGVILAAPAISLAAPAINTATIGFCVRFPGICGETARAIGEAVVCGLTDSDSGMLPESGRDLFGAAISTAISTLRNGFNNNLQGPNPFNGIPPRQSGPVFSSPRK